MLDSHRVAIEVLKEGIFISQCKTAWVSNGVTVRFFDWATNLKTALDSIYGHRMTVDLFRNGVWPPAKEEVSNNFGARCGV